MAKTTNLVADTLYKIIKNGDTSNTKAVLNITGLPAISYGSYSNQDTLPTTFAELSADKGVDDNLIEGKYTTEFLGLTEYIGFSGTGTVSLTVDFLLVLKVE